MFEQHLGKNELKLVVFRLADEEFGAPIGQVHEILRLVEITRVPRAPRFIEGIINLRGKVIPVIDLRLKFGLEPAEYTEQTCIVVVDVGSLVGIIVDTVQEVLDIDAGQIDPPPPLGASVDTSFVLGMGKVKDDVKILLDIDKVLGSDEIAAVLEEAAQVAQDA